MTCILGIVDTGNKKVWIGADSAGVGNYDLTIRKDVKVFKNGDFLIGCTSSFRMIQLLRFKFKIPHLKDMEIYEFMCTDFIDAVRKCFQDNGYMQKTTQGEDRGGTFLVGYKDRLFYIEGDFQVGESHIGIDACGCGANFAIGSSYALMHQTATNTTAIDHIVGCGLRAAEEFSAGAAGPFNILST